MSAFDDILTGGLAVQFDTHGQPVDYFSAAAAAWSTATAIVGAEEIVLIDAVDGTRTRRRQRSVQVVVGTGSGEVADPRERDIVMIDGEEWTVTETAAVGNGFAEMIISRPERSLQGGRRKPGT